MKKLFLLLFLSLNLIAQAQETTEEEMVISSIKAMFDGMRAGDSAMVSHVFADNLEFYTIFKTKKGEHVMKKGNAQKFLEAVGTPHDKVWDERIWSYDVKIDGLMATAWTEYSFYIGDEFSHCGVNAFTLFKTAAGWKIVNVTDTRRKSTCKESKTDVINTMMDNWHKAAATADEDAFFGAMTQDGIYIGTDASERWLRDEIKEWSKKYFERDSAWDFTPTERNIAFSDDGTIAWFDELLDTWMGVCRGSGVLVLTENGWKIKHYHLSMAIPNELVEDYMKILKKSEKKK